MFKLIKEQEIKSLEITYQEFEHVETKARHIHLKCDDHENAFVCAFNTTSDNSTGVAHILEHSTLQGCRDFNIPNTFFNMFKKTLCTFLNANTYPYMTTYPHSSQNKKDFFNVMHVTTNLTFFPLLKKEDFLQEGWRYEFEEMENPDSKLQFKGVVFNEMKGAMTQEDHITEFSILGHLYPDTPFAKNYGGDPKNIPDLSYEEFKAFHKKFYHPSNAIFFTYGDIPAKETQEKLEEFVLNEFTFEEVDTNFKKQEPFKEPKQITELYPLNKENSAENNYFIKSWDISATTNQEEGLAISFVENLILGDSSCALKAAIENSHLAKSNYVITDVTSERTFLSIVCQGVKEEDKENLNKIIENTLSDIVNKELGLSDEKIKNTLHQLELYLKSKNSGRMSYGLDTIYKVATLAIAGSDTSEVLDIDKTLNKAKEIVKNKENLKSFIKEKLINNNHRVDIYLQGDKELYEKEVQDEQDKLAEVKKNLTPEQTKKIIENSLALIKQQTCEQNLDELPEFSAKDIPEDLFIEPLQKRKINDKFIYAFNAPTSGLTTIKKSGNMKDLKVSDLGYLNIYNIIANSAGFDKYSYTEAEDIKNAISKGLSISATLCKDLKNSNKPFINANLRVTCLQENIEKVSDLMNTFVNNIRFDESELIKRKIKEAALGLKTSYSDSGHSYAISLAASKINENDKILYNFDGLGYIQFMQNVAENIDNDDFYNDLISKLKEINVKIKEAINENSAVFITDLEENLEKDMAVFSEKAIETPIKYYLEDDSEKVKEEVCLSSANVNYVSGVMKTINRDHELSGALKVLSSIIKMDYAFKEIREKGGAYGGVAGFNDVEGYFYLFSYRDPSLSKTIKVYKNLKEWLQDENNYISEKSIESGILQNISAFDKPALKHEECELTFNRFLANSTNENLIKFRTKILKTTPEQLKELVNKYILPELDSMIFAAVANKKQFEEENLDFKTIEI